MSRPKFQVLKEVKRALKIIQSTSGPFGFNYDNNEQQLLTASSSSAYFRTTLRAEHAREREKCLATLSAGMLHNQVADKVLQGRRNTSFLFRAREFSLFMAACTETCGGVL
jgi:hypothetical protein